MPRRTDTCHLGGFALCGKWNRVPPFRGSPGGLAGGRPTRPFLPKERAVQGRLSPPRCGNKLPQPAGPVASALLGLGFYFRQRPAYAVLKASNQNNIFLWKASAG